MLAWPDLRHASTRNKETAWEFGVYNHLNAFVQQLDECFLGFGVGENVIVDVTVLIWSDQGIPLIRSR